VSGKVSTGALTGALVVALLFAAAPAAHSAQRTSIIERAAESLQEDPIYVHASERSEVTASEEERLADRIAEANVGAVYVAVLPETTTDEAGGSASGVISMLAETVGRRGIYAVTVGDTFQAGNTEEAGNVPDLATAAVEAQAGEDASAVLFDFIGRLESAGASSDGGGGFGLFPLILIGVAAFFLFRFAKRRSDQRRREQEELAEVKGVAEEDLVALGEDLRALEIDVEMPGADPDAKRSYVRALECYERARADLDGSRRLQDLEPVTAALEEGRWAMASARAHLEHREPPERRSPCFFDPRHGPSVRDVSWSPPGGIARDVPACEADANRVARGLEPESREITVGGRSLPYWNAPAYYGPWAGGYFGGFGLFEGFLIGSMFGGGFGSGWGDGGVDSGGDSGGDWGGDFGGGDFGGGDFGGGDFGGGDFGG
jgi:hypothetical protein